ncbi:Tn3 family transposase [Streptomyces sp. NPDC058486]|uniref:Tn3 family transposase n=1 Tax=unclassified Streptomyces TaxID=2593676 RepID=UPI00365F52B6
MSPCGRARSPPRCGRPGQPHRATPAVSDGRAAAPAGDSQWVGFGDGGVIADNDIAEQGKTAKFNVLLSKAVIFHDALDFAEIVRRPQAEGTGIGPEDLASVRSPFHLVGCDLHFSVGS